ncbi:MAG: hypothetical protein CM1200mP13_03270 [Candidatus Pelagibacterales bacterium]|nr:MAG: hypothetical protein CM1200mP13_03270 [Pelagibacterales bacterium]
MVLGKDLKQHLLMQKKGKTSFIEKNLIEFGKKQIHHIPDDFNAHKKIRKIYQERKQSIIDGKNIDWATAESLAFATLLKEGYGVLFIRSRFWRGIF